MLSRCKYPSRYCLVVRCWKTLARDTIFCMQNSMKYKIILIMNEQYAYWNVKIPEIRQ